MAAVTYLPSPIVSPPIKSDESNLLSILACTLALGTLGYYAPRTFYATGASLVGLSVWGFPRLVSSSTPKDTPQLRTLAIRICTVMTSVGIVSVFRGAAFEASRPFHLLRTGGNFIAAAALVLAGAALCHFNYRAFELMKTKDWDQMADFLQIKEHVQELTKTQLFILIFFPHTTVEQPNLGHQFKSPEKKFITLQRYLRWADNYSIFAIHDFQAQPFWNQETLMPQLVRIGRASPKSVDLLPDNVRLRVQTAIANYRNTEMSWSSFEAFQHLHSIPEVGTSDWEVFVDAVNKILGFNHRQDPYLGWLRQMITASRQEQVEQLPAQIRKTLKI
jgi:hypothetical protein